METRELGAKQYNACFRLGVFHRVVFSFAIFYIVLGAPLPAMANVGLPMIMLAWPFAWTAILIVIPLEAMVAMLVLRIGPRRGFTLATRANVISTLVGIPACWVGAVAVQMAALEIMGISDFFKVPLPKVIDVPLFVLGSSPWVGFVGGDAAWLVPAAMLCLNILFFFGSVIVEYHVGKTVFSKEA